MTDNTVAGGSDTNPGKRKGSSKLSGWQIVYNAVRQAGRPVAIKKIEEEIARSNPSHNASNTRPDLEKITVNSFSRGHHQPSALPRRSDSGHHLDLLYKDKISGGNVTYAPYVPSRHGVWELYRDDAATTKSKLRVRALTTGMLAEAILHAEAANTGDMDLETLEDTRKRIAQLIVARRGQSRFRNGLLEAYEGRCAITRSTAQEVLEAAHIIPYMGEQTNDVTNGLLLRADVHTLFDLGHVWIENGIVMVAPHLAMSEYGEFAGKALLLPEKAEFRPSKTALEWHRRMACAGHP